MELPSSVAEICLLQHTANQQSMAFTVPHNQELEDFSDLEREHEWSLPTVLGPKFLLFLVEKILRYF